MTRYPEDIGVDVDELIDSINLDKGLRAAFSELTADELAALLAEFANLANLPNAAIKRAKADLPPPKWTKFSREYGLPLNASHVNLAPFMTPRYRLPPSLHETMFENAWRWQYVYDYEGARMRLLRPYIVTIVGLFQGRVIDKPERPMVETQYSTGDDVEHEFFMIGGILFCIVELKSDIPSNNNLAQLFIELVSGAVRNHQLNLEGLRIYGLLTNFTEFKFYSYNPITNQFCFDENISINDRRVTAWCDMIDVSNKIFGVILTAYIDGLRATISRRANQNDPLKLATEIGGHGSTDRWEAALEFAERCVDKFNESVVGVQDIEARANDALELLAKSVRSIPRPFFFTGSKDPSTPAELKALAADVVKAEYEQVHWLDLMTMFR